ncbi:MAG: tRNA lysidine(34) synthetase TilS [Saprospirales bacterium]|nr:tRNA lysidine(34) synthetase TilS [Saprospirales bacterium]
MDLLHRFQRFIQTNGLLQPRQRVLAAVSGGVDSVVLAHLFRESKQDFGIVHCNFRLRGEESDGDEDFVRALAARWSVPFFAQHFDTKKYAAGNGLSTQMAARALRYRWFEVVREAEDFDLVATGHHLSDSVETALLHFIRGTGLTGLGGIPLRNGAVVRPLLFATRAEIEAYARAQGLSWREDSSNALDDYTRNAVRHHILPGMEALNPAFFDAAAKTLRQLRAADDNLQYLLGGLLGAPDAGGAWRLEKTALEALPALADALFDILQPFGFHAGQVQQMAHCWNQTGTEWHTDSGYRLVMDRSALLLTNKNPRTDGPEILADDLLVRLPDGSRLVLLHTATAPDVAAEQTAAVLDAGNLTFPLRLRRWQPGDVFQPLGMAGHSQKLQDFFTNLKLSRLEKEQAWILEDGQPKIAWVVGMRLDERVKTSPHTRKFLRIEWVGAPASGAV